MGASAVTGIASTLYLAILLGWVGFAVTGTWIAGLGMLALSLVSARTVVMRALTAFLDPIGIVLPLLAIRHFTMANGVNLPSYSLTVQVGLLVIYCLFLASSTGLIRANLYRLGYRAFWVMGIAGAVILFGLLTKDIFIPLIAVVGQVTWVLRVGSSNYFDHVTHALLVPILLISILTGLF